MSAADQLWSDIEKSCERVAALPVLGHRRTDLTTSPDALFFCVRKNYLIVYRKDSNPLEIARILHAARDAESELFDDE